MISTGRPSSPPLALTSSRQISMAACSILPAGAPAPVSARLMPTLIGLPLCADAPEVQHNPASSATATAPSVLLVVCIMIPSLGGKVAPGLFLPCVGVRIDQVSGLCFRRPHDRLRLAVTELIEVVRLSVLDLRPVHARLHPFAVLAEGEIAGHGLEARLVHVFGKLVVVETLGFSDRLRQHLAAAVGERSPGKAQRVDAGRSGLLRIAL